MKGKKRERKRRKEGDERRRGNRNRGEMVKKEEHGETKGIDSNKEV